MLKEWTPERLSLCRRRCNYSSVPRPPPVRLAISSDDVNESPPSTPKRMRGNLNEIVNFTSFLKFSGSFHFFSLPRIKNRNNNNIWKCQLFAVIIISKISELGDFEFRRISFCESRSRSLHRSSDQLLARTTSGECIIRISCQWIGLIKWSWFLIIHRIRIRRIRVTKVEMERDKAIIICCVFNSRCQFFFSIKIIISGETIKISTTVTEFTKGIT